VGPGCCHRRACARRSSHPLSPRWPPAPN